MFRALLSFAPFIFGLSNATMQLAYYGSNLTNIGPTHGTLGQESGSSFLGSRSISASFYNDTEKMLYIYGGMLSNGTSLTDIWRYNTVTRNWAWYGGPAYYKSANYGVKGSPGADVIPPVRFNYAHFYIDNKFYFFGGELVIDSGSRLNDLWSFDFNIRQYAWLKGSSLTNKKGTYGAINAVSSAYGPGARDSCSIVYVNDVGEAYMFGGYGLSDNTAGEGTRADLWSYNPLTNMWTLRSGSAAGVGNTLTEPQQMGGRSSPTSFYETPYIYFFGSFGSELWRYNVNTAAWKFLGGINDKDVIYGPEDVEASSIWPYASWDAITVHRSGDQYAYIYDKDRHIQWRYNLQNSNWTFLKKAADDTMPVYSASIGVNSNTSAIGPRFGCPMAIDGTTGDIYIFGGSIDYFNTIFQFGDIWRWSFPSYTPSVVNTSVSAPTLSAVLSTSTLVQTTTSPSPVVYTSSILNTETLPDTASSGVLSTSKSAQTTAPASVPDTTSSGVLSTSTSAQTTAPASVPDTTSSDVLSTSTSAQTTAPASAVVYTSSITSAPTLPGTTSSTGEITTSGSSVVYTSNTISTATLVEAIDGVSVTKNPTASHSFEKVRTVEKINKADASSAGIAAPNYLILTIGIAGGFGMLLFACCGTYLTIQFTRILSKERRITSGSTADYLNSATTTSVFIDPHSIPIGNLTKSIMNEERPTFYDQIQGTSMYTQNQGTTLFTQNAGLSMPAFTQFEMYEFRFVAKLASGGAGEVYLSEGLTPRLCTTGQQIIIKILKNSNANDARTINLFQQEVSVMYLLSKYQNIAQIIGYCNGPPLCIIMKFYPLGSLSDFRKKHGLTKEIIVKFAKGVSNGLAAMHMNFLAHMDLKPQNVLIDRSVSGSYLAVLADFGISRVLSDKILLVKEFQTVNIRGLSAAYASPEAFKIMNGMQDNSSDLSYDAFFKASDVFSTACLLLYLVSGKHPWSS